MKKLLTAAVICLVLISIAFTGCAKTEGGKQTYVIKVAYGTAGGPIHEASVEFEKRIQAADPRVDVQIFPGGQLGSEGEIVGQLQAGLTDMLPTTTGPLGQLNPIYYVLESPYVFLNEEQADKVLDGDLGKIFLDGLKVKGLIGLAFWESGFREISNNIRPIRAPGDLSGVKLRVQQNQLHIQYFRSLGANPTPLAFTEIYNALATKVVDGQENPFSLIATNKFYEQQKYVSKTDHVYSAVPVFFSEKKWNALPKDIQDLVAKTVYDLRIWERNRGRELQNEYIAEIEKKSAVLILSDTQKAAFQEKAAGAYEWASKEYGSVYGDLLKRVQEAVK